MKRLVAILLSITLLLTLTSCGAAEPQAETTMPETAPVAETTVPETTVPETTVPETTEETEPYVEPPEFTLKVRTKRISSRIEKEVKRFKKESGIVTTNLMIDDIPALIATVESSEPKPITIFVHPAAASKEIYYVEIGNVAVETKGIAVTIDGGAWGASPRGRMTDAETIAAMPADLDKVIAYCSTLEGADINKISILGYSMGGTAVLTYLAYGTFTPLCGYAGAACADFSLFTGSSSPYRRHGTNTRKGDFLNKEEIKALLAAYSPMNQVERMMDTNLMVEAGLQDDASSVDSCKALEAKFQEMGKENCQFNYYDADHSYLAWHGKSKIEKNALNWLMKSLEEGNPVNNPTPVVTIE